MTPAPPAPPYRFLLLKMLSYELYHHARHNLGLRSYTDFVRHLWDAWTFDLRYGVSTRGEIPADELGFEEHIIQAQAVRYSPAPPFCVRNAFRQLKKYLPGFEGVTFVDYGCGKGRVMLLALEAGFRQVIGLDLSRPLVAQCRENIRLYTRPQSNPEYALVLQQNAATYLPPPAARVFFFFNPFSASLFDQVAAQIADSIIQHPRAVYTMTLGSDYDFASAGFKLIDQVTGVRLFCNA